MDRKPTRIRNIKADNIQIQALPLNSRPNGVLFSINQEDLNGKVDAVTFTDDTAVEIMRFMQDELKR
jgi:hypothetical protein